VKTVTAILFVCVLSLGCTGTIPGTSPQGPIDCKENADCINQAIENNCQDAHLEQRIDPSNYSLGSVNLRVIVTNQKTSCKVEAIQTDAENERLASVEVEFKLPLEKCGTDDDPQSYVTVDEKCKWMEFK
jgi:hypothetical protein